MNLCDVIAEFIYERLSNTGTCEIGRNELAAQFNCAPSQISYVLSTRFSPNQGYVVQSRRGGGGYIRIKKMCADRQQKVMHIVNSIGNEIDANTANIFLVNMASDDYITQNEVKLISAAINEKSFKIIPMKARPSIRAVLFKNMLISLL